jgi:hypothetical protein
VTLQEAADYIIKLSKADRDLPEWQAAGEALIMAAEGRGPLMHAFSKRGVRNRAAPRYISSGAASARSSMASLDVECTACLEKANRFTLDESIPKVDVEGFSAAYVLQFVEAQFSLAGFVTLRLTLHDSLLIW